MPELEPKASHVHIKRSKASPLVHPFTPENHSLVVANENTVVQQPTTSLQTAENSREEAVKNNFRRCQGAESQPAASCMGLSDRQHRDSETACLENTDRQCQLSELHQGKGPSQVTFLILQPQKYLSKYPRRRPECLGWQLAGALRAGARGKAL